MDLGQVRQARVAGGWGGLGKRHDEDQIEAPLMMNQSHCLEGEDQIRF